MSSPQLLILVALGLSLGALFVATRTKQLGVVVVAYAVLVAAQVLLLFTLRQVDPRGAAWLVPVAALGLLAYNAARWLWRMRTDVPKETPEEEADDLSWLRDPPDSNVD